MNSRINHHRGVIRVFVNNLIIHLHKIAIPVFNNMFAKTFDRISNPRFAEPLREEIRANAEQLARAHGLEIEFIRSVGAFRKEDRIQAVLAARGTQPGLVHIFSAMEPCAGLHALARQGQRQDHPALQGRQVPALLLLFPGRGVRAVLPAGADLGAVPAAVLLQRA